VFVSLQSRLLPSLPEDCPRVHGKKSMPMMTSDLKCCNIGTKCVCIIGVAFGCCTWQIISAES
jgi:hypothetical protein